MSQPSPDRSRPWHLAWATVFVANLTVPLLFGWDVTRDGGRTGMIAAVVLVWLAGHSAVARWRGLRTVLVFGAACTAVSQVYPVLQIIAGAVSLKVVGYGADGGLSEASGFVATLLTGAQILAVAVLCGLVIRACRRAAHVADGAATSRPSSP